MVIFKRPIAISRAILFVFVLLIIVEACATMLIVFGMVDMQMDSITDSMRQRNTQLIEYMGNITREVTENTQVYLVERDFLSILLKDKHEKPNAAYSADQLYVKQLIRQNTVLSPYLEGVTIVSQSGEVFDNTGKDEGNLALLAQIRQRMGAEGLERDVAPVEALSVHRVTRHVMLVTHRVLNPYTRQVAGYIHYHIGLEKLLNAFMQSEQAPQDAKLSVLHDGRPIISKGRAEGNGKLSQTKIDTFLAQGRFDQAVRVDDELGGHYLVGTWSPDYGIVLLQSLPAEKLLSGLPQLLGGYLLLSITLLLATVVLGLFLRRRLTRASDILLDGIGAIERGEILPIAETGIEELNLVVRDYNDIAQRFMESRANEARMRKTEEQMREQQQHMELRLLQAQINPHFIYNTLNLISSIALMEGSEAISSTAIDMAHMLYYNLRGKDVVTVADELEQVRRYMHIQQLRFPDRFSVEIDIPESIRRAPVVRFILQPIVENAMYHGLEKKAGAGKLWLSAWREPGTIVLRVEDNGLGVDSETYARLCALLEDDHLGYQTDNKQMGIGLLNVHNRLRHAYGAGAGIRLLPRDESGGLCVCIRFAAQDGPRGDTDEDTDR